jgi:hypothetical protein
VADCERFLDSGLDQGEGCCERGVYTQVGGVEQDCICRRLERGYAAIAVARVSRLNIREHGTLRYPGTGLGEFKPATLCANRSLGVDKELRVRLGAYNCAYVAAVHHCPGHTIGWLDGEAALVVEKRGPHTRKGGNDRGGPGNIIAAQIEFLGVGGVDRLCSRNSCSFIICFAASA